jgi:hypothetical protein
MGKQVEMYVGGAVAVTEQIKSGVLHALAVTTATRSEALPQVAAVGEFVPGYEASVFNGLGAPRNTSSAIIDRLNKEINAGLADPKLKQRLAEAGGTVLSGSPADFGKLIADETEKWARVIRGRQHQGRIAHDFGSRSSENHVRDVGTKQEMAGVWPGEPACLPHLKNPHRAPGKQNQTDDGHGGSSTYPFLSHLTRYWSCIDEIKVGQNFTYGGVCVVSPAVNSAIGLLPRNTVMAQARPGKVLSSVL